MTNKYLVLAGTLSLVLTLVHIVGGGTDVHAPLLVSNASDVLKGFISVIWHTVTAALLTCSFMLFIASKSERHRTMLTGLVIVHYSAFTGLFIFYGISRLGTVFLMLPWVGFLVIVMVAAIGLLFDKNTQMRDTTYVS